MEKCDLCGQPAVYDARIIEPIYGMKRFKGAWCYVCECCFVDNGCKLGIGFGSKLQATITDEKQKSGYSRKNLD